MSSGLIDQRDTQKEVLDQEDSYRKLFAEERFMFTTEVHYNRYLACISVWDNMEMFHYQEETEEEKRVPKILTKHRKKLTGSAVVEPQEFMRRWDEFTLGIFNGMDWNNVYAAGGAVLACICNPPMDDTFKGSDIDLFIWGIYDEETANNKLRHIHDVIMRNSGGKGHIVRTKRAVTILNQYPYRHVQVILRLYKNPGEVLLGFDIDSCSIGYDGAEVYAEERFRRALCKGYNLVNKSRRSTTYEIRLYKYSKRGFAVAVPDLDKERVNPKIFQKHVGDAEGLCKLLLFEHSVLHPTSPFVKSRNTNNSMAMQILNQQVNRNNPMQVEEGRLAEIEALQSEHPSDYSDLYIPWGPSWYTNNIVRMLRYKEKMEHAQRVNQIKRKKLPSRVKHQHRFVFGIDGVISGKAAWCIICQQPHVPNPEKDVKSQTTKFINGPIEWMVDVPAYQDYDNGFLRCLLSGSFEPVNTNFEEGVYLSEEEITEGHKSLIRYLLGKPKEEISGTEIKELTMHTNVEKEESVFECSSCATRFPSLNRLRKHRRLGCDKDKFKPIQKVEISTDEPSSPILLGCIEPKEEQFYYQEQQSSIPEYWKRPEVSYSSLTPSYEIDQDFIPTWAIPPPMSSQFTAGLPTENVEPSPMAKRLLLLSKLFKQEIISKEERLAFKDIILAQNDLVDACWCVFEIDQDVHELVDSLRKIIEQN